MAKCWWGQYWGWKRWYNIKVQGCAPDLVEYDKSEFTSEEQGGADVQVGFAERGQVAALQVWHNFWGVNHFDIFLKHIEQWLYHTNLFSYYMHCQYSRTKMGKYQKQIFYPMQRWEIKSFFSWKMQTYSSRRRQICWANRKWTTQRRTKIGMKRFVTIKRLFCCMTSQVKKAWRLFDKNGDGKISKQEFRWDNYLI